MLHDNRHQHIATGAIALLPNKRFCILHTIQAESRFRWTVGVHGLVVNVHKGIPPSGTDQSGDCSVRAAVRRLQARRMRRGGTSSTTREMAERAGQRAVSRSRGRPPSVFLKPTPAGRAATHEDEDKTTEAVADTIAAERGADKAFSITNYVSLTLFLLAVAYPLSYTLSASFSDPRAVSSGRMRLFPVDVTLDGSRTAFNNSRIITGFQHSLSIPGAEPSPASC